LLALTGLPIFGTAAAPDRPKVVKPVQRQLQRAAFLNRMDPHHQWHVRMAEPVIAQTVDIVVAPETGSLSAGSGGTFSGDVLIDFLDAQAQTILQFLNLPPDTAPSS
jgi:hypothetical protein